MKSMIAVDQEATMTSLEFLKNIINPARLEYGEPEVENRHFLSRIEDEIDDLGVAENFYVTTEQGASRAVRGYKLNMEQMTLIGMRESKAVRRSVLAKLKVMHSPSIPQTLPEALRLAADLAEQVAMRAGGWQKARMEQQMYEWFGDVPTFIITLAADYCAQCSDLEFCALIEHELYHISHATDEYGAPKFNKEGQPVLKLRGHDVEEFVGVVRRYGASVEVQEMIDAANNKPEVGNLNIARACGTCLLKLA